MKSGAVLSQPRERLFRVVAQQFGDQRVEGGAVVHVNAMGDPCATVARRTKPGASSSRQL